MKLPTGLRICFISLVMCICFSTIGVLVNHVSPRGIPLEYEPPRQIEISGLKVPLIDEKQAYKHFNEQGFVFIDTRHLERFNEAHVPRAIFLPLDDVQGRFIEAQPFMMENDTLILYCYGPDCDMAEKVAAFLAQMGYRNFMIMASGFSAWKSAGLPIEASRR